MADYNNRTNKDIQNSLKDITDLNRNRIQKSIDFLKKAASDSERVRKQILDGLKKIIIDYGNLHYSNCNQAGITKNMLKLNVPDGLRPGEITKYKKLIKASVIEQAAIETVLSIVGPAALLDSEYEWFDLIDRSGMIERLGKWPIHIKVMNEEAIKAAAEFREKHKAASITKIKIFGLGGSAAPEEIAKEIIENSRKCGLDIEIVRADTPNTDTIDGNTLTLFCSFSGDTEETVNCFRKVNSKTDFIAGIAQGGELKSICNEKHIPFVQLPNDKSDPAYVLQPRESVCLQCIAVLSFLSQIGGLKEGSRGALSSRSFDFGKLRRSVAAWRKRYGPDVNFVNNPAKKLAFFMLYGFDYSSVKDAVVFDVWDKKIPYVIGDYNLRGLTHEVVTQFRERSKACAVEGIAPEELHNSVEAIRASLESSNAYRNSNPFVYLFLDSADSEPRIGFRLEKTRNLVLEGKAPFALLTAEGDTPLERAFSLLYFNAHMTTYAAAVNGFDPLPVPTMSWIKKVMAEFPRNRSDEKQRYKKRCSIVKMQSFGRP